jgi:hypothetical protein
MAGTVPVETLMAPFVAHSDNERTPGIWKRFLNCGSDAGEEYSLSCPSNATINTDMAGMHAL